MEYASALQAFIEISKKIVLDVKEELSGVDLPAFFLVESNKYIIKLWRDVNVEQDMGSSMEFAKFVLEISF